MKFGTRFAMPRRIGRLDSRTRAFVPLLTTTEALLSHFRRVYAWNDLRPRGVFVAWLLVQIPWLWCSHIQEM